jgi:hypothetical protein
MASKKKLLQAAAGAAGAEALDIDDVFSTYLYEGTGSSFSINNNIDLNGEGGLVWLKERTSVGSLGWHSFFDTARGTAKYLSSNNNSAEASSSGVTAFNSNGFTLGDTGLVNQNTGDFVSWTFRKAPKFFDVVTYSGQNTDLALSHNLGVAPGMVIVKRTNTTGSWAVYHRGLNLSDNLILNNTSDTGSNNWWTTTAPTDTTFNLLGNKANTNQSGSTYVAYLFAHNDGDGEFGPDSDQDIIKCGSYTGVSATEISVDLGFEPQWVMIKRATSVSLASYASWFMQDTMRGMVAKGADAKDNVLYANKSSAEGFRGDGTSSTTTEIQIHPNATGFTVPSTNSVEVNQAGETYIYMAIRRGPLAEPESATDVFQPHIYTGDGSTRKQDLNITPDMVINMSRSVSGDSNALNDRLRGSGKELYTSGTGGEVQQSLGMQFDYTNAIEVQDYRDTNNATYLNLCWKRAPSYFDCVCYSGNGTAGRTVSHNLGIPPEMMWVKCRSESQAWVVYHKGMDSSAPEDYGIYLNDTTGRVDSANFWNDTAPTSSVFTLGVAGKTNGSSKTYIAYLFATVPNVSFVGSYTGNDNGSNSQVIDCGFSSGARFVLIKLTSTGGYDWYVFDTERGIVAGDDPYLLLNTTGTEQTVADMIDPNSSGFEVTGSTLNVSGASYIFYAIA